MPHSRLRRFIVIPIVLMLVGVVAAQDAISEACAAIIQQAISRASACENLTGSQACYVHGPLSYVPRDAPEPFAMTGDVIEVFDFLSLTSAAVDTETGDYGIAILTLTDTPTNQPRMVMLGDVLVRDAGPDAFTIRTGPTPLFCDGAVNAVLLQTPPNTPYEMNINGADIRLAGSSVAVLRVDANQAMSLHVVTGVVDVTAREVTERLLLGQFTQVTVGLAEGLLVLSAPAAPARYDGEALQAIPLPLVMDNLVEVGTRQAWIPTGIEVQVGDVFVLQATGYTQTGADLPWSVAEGLSRVDCATFGRSDWDCACRLVSEFGACTIDNLASMTLVGRIGRSQPFVAGAGGVFQAQNSGELFLGANDNTFNDNLGSFHVVVHVFPANR